MLSLQCVSPLVVPSKGKRSHSSTRLETKPSEGPCVRTHGGQASPRQACAVGENASPPRSCRPPAPSRPGRQRRARRARRRRGPNVPAGFRPRRTRRGGGAQGQGQPAKRGEGSGGPSRRCAPPAARLAAAAAPGGRRADDGWPVRRPGSEQRGAGECKHERAPRLPALGRESERPAQKDPARNV